MTRPILHRQSGYWTNIASYPVDDRPDLYASLAAVTLPDSGSISRRFLGSALLAPFRGTVARKATDLSWANAVPAPRHSGFAPSRNLRSVSAIRRVSAFAIDALMWAVFAGCFLLLASGAL